MTRVRVAQIILALVGLVFVATIYVVITGILHPTPTNYSSTMMMSLYVTLGVFLLIAVRNPAKHRSVILFAIWSSFAHAATMVGQSIFVTSGSREFLLASAFFTVVGALLLVAVPARTPVENTSAVTV